jgi:hypothetical protein
LSQIFGETALALSSSGGYFPALKKLFNGC